MAVLVEIQSLGSNASAPIREAETLKVPYMAIVGEREAADGTVAVRKRGAGKKQDVIAREEFVRRITEEISERVL